ncbi:MAG: GNAT family N-acetyltransferase [Chitinophagales bacterium]
MELIFINEFEIVEKMAKSLYELLQSCFPEAEYRQRIYFKQLPHYRILALENKKLVGQLGIDYRVMNLNGEAVKVFGVVDLCVTASMRGKGIGKKLMLEFEAIAKRNRNGIDFLFLVTDDAGFYEKLGYQQTKLTTTWLKIDQHNNYGQGTEAIDDAFFMVKAVSDKVWENGDLDMLGYMY